MKRIEKFEQIIRSGISEEKHHGTFRTALNEGRVLVRAWREYLNMTQAEVAEKIGMSSSLLSLLENTRATLRPVTIERLAAVFEDPKEYRKP